MELVRLEAGYAANAANAGYAGKLAMLQAGMLQSGCLYSLYVAV